MIASVHGPVTVLGGDSVVLEVGGVGLLVSVTPQTSASLRIGEPARLVTTLVVREDSLTLFGFLDADERDVFTLVQTTSGVGPRLAMSILSVHSPDSLRQAVADGDITALMRVPGVGRKGAMKLALELKDRIGPPRRPTLPATTSGSSWREQVHGALLGLGYSAREADDAVAAVAAEATDGQPVAVLLKAALRALART